MLDDKTRQRILEEETAKFLDPNFGQLDLSDYPDYSKPPKEESFLHEGYGQLDTTGLGLGSKALQEFINNPDYEALSIAAEETKNPELIQTVNEERAGRTAERFVKRHPEYFGTDENMEAIYNEVARAAGLVGEIDAGELYASGHSPLRILSGLTSVC